MKTKNKLRTLWCVIVALTITGVFHPRSHAPKHERKEPIALYAPLMFHRAVEHESEVPESAPDFPPREMWRLTTGTGAYEIPREARVPFPTGDLSHLIVG